LLGTRSMRKTRGRLILNKTKSGFGGGHRCPLLFDVRRRRAGPVGKNQQRPCLRGPPLLRMVYRQIHAPTNSNTISDAWPAGLKGARNQLQGSPGVARSRPMRPPALSRLSVSEPSGSRLVGNPYAARSQSPVGAAAIPLAGPRVSRGTRPLEPGWLSRRPLTKAARRWLSNVVWKGPDIQWSPAWAGCCARTHSEPASAVRSRAIAQGICWRRNAPCSVGLIWVTKRHFGCLAGTAEVPHIPDRFAAAPNASPLCRFRCKSRSDV
jgi:hypothetical protein